jgi:plasmid stability protein
VASVASTIDERKTLFLRVPEGLKRKLRVAAARKGISMSQHATTLLTEALAWEHVAERVLDPDPDLAP